MSDTPAAVTQLKRVARAAYRAIPHKGRIFEAVRGVWTPPERLYRHLHFEGPFTSSFEGKSFTLFHAGTCIENTLFWEGIGSGWERVSLRVWARLSGSSEVILDIGANTGVYAVIAAAMNPRAKVVAFEPNPLFHRAISECNALNGFDIKLKATALSDTTGTIAFSGYEVDPAASTGDLRSGWTEVPMTTLSSIIEDEPLTRVDLIKCDVERHEPQVFAGMGRYLADFSPDILVEVLDDQRADELARLFDPLGYRYYSIDDVRGSISRVDHLQKSVHWNVLVCRAETGDLLEADRTLPWV